MHTHSLIKSIYILYQTLTQSFTDFGYLDIFKFEQVQMGQNTCREERYACMFNTSHFQGERLAIPHNI